MSNTSSGRVGTFIAFIISALFVAGAIWLFFNRQYAIDQVAVWSYEPSAAIEAIDTKVQFTDKGKFVFYATHPSVEDQASFNKECPRQETGSPILGCYTTDDRIYIYNLTNEELQGMEEVTAAHEMLHAVWYRTSEADREKLTTELRAAYEKITDDVQLKTRMEYYERTEPGEIGNELHSILGTEVESLSESLEAYYAQFFDRESVIELHDQYSGVYTALYERADTLYGQMQSLATTIDAQSNTYETDVTQLSADIADFNDRAKSGAFTSQAAFNSERAALVRRTNALDAQRQEINANIETYNTYYNEYQEISKQIEVLNDSIDSFKQVEAAPSV